MDKKFKIKLLPIFLISLFLLGIFFIHFVTAESFDSSDEREIGYEFLDNNSVVHIWNTQDDYYFNRSSGIQFTNYHNEYWTHNTFCGGFKISGEWEYKCNDALPFTWNIETDNETYVNYTGYRDITRFYNFKIYKIRIALRYHLKLDDKNLSVQPSVKNTGIHNIPVDVGFAWIVDDIKIMNDYEDDKIFINYTDYSLNESLDLSFTNLENTYYRLHDKAFVQLDWNKNSNYRLNIKDVGQNNSRVTLGINGGPLSIGQQKYTTLFWRDPIEFGNVATGSTAELNDNMTWNHTMTCGDDMVLIVGIAVDSEPTATVSSITYNGTSLTKTSSDSSADGEVQAEIWNLTNPDCGISLPIVVAYNNPTKEESSGISSVYYGVDYINLSSVRTAKSDGSTSSTLDTPSQSSNNRVVNIFALDTDAGSGITISGDNVTQRGYSNEGAVTAAIGDGYDSDGTVTIGWSGFNDEWVQIGVELIRASAVYWNQSTLELGESTNNITSVVKIDTLRSNTNTQVTCTGNCTQITTNWTTQNTNDGDSDEVLITCSNATEGIFNAIFNVTSDNDTSINLLNVTCEIFTYGWLDVSISKPDDNSDWYEGNTNLTINATITCEGGTNARCGTIEAKARYGTTTADTIINTTDGALPFYISAAEGWNLSTATYDNVNISTQYSIPGPIYFSPDGTKLYEAGSNTIYQSTCDAWNLSTCTFDVSISTQEASLDGIFFSSDGTNMYQIDSTTDLIYQSTCDAWNLSTCTYDGVNIPIHTDFPHGIFFSSDGTNMYTIETSTIYQYSCTDAWNLSTCTYDKSKVTTGGSSTYAFYFSPDGTKLYEANHATDLIYQSTCDAWNLSTCTFDVSISTQALNCKGIFFSSDGTNMYQIDSTTDLIYQHSLEAGSANIQTSETILNKGDSWNVSWELNVTSSTDESFKLDALFNSSYGNSLVSNNNTADRTVNLNPIEVDTTKPTYSLNQTNNTAIGQSTLFSIQYNDTTALHSKGQYIFSTNNTGTWQNESAVNFTATPSWANVTKVLNSTEGISIGYRWYADDNAGNINNTGIFTVTTTLPTFDSTWDTTKSGVSNSTTIKLPLESSGTYNFIVDWGDGNTSTVSTWNSVNATHTYATGGIYNVSISGTIIGWRFNHGGDRQKISDISNWGVLNVGNNGAYFSGCSNLDSSATDILNLTETTIMVNMFYHASAFNGNISNWDTSSVTTTNNMFRFASNFNQPLNNWDTSSVTNMAEMFSYASAFNQSLNNWDTSSVTNMVAMFNSASAFNQDISGWCVSNIDSEPTAFSADCPLTSENKPVWGTCPGIDTTKPTYSNNAHNQTAAGQSTKFSIQYNDTTALHPNGQYIFSTNNTGTWVNESVINFTATPSWANVTKVLNSTEGISIGYRWYVDDNVGNINNTGIFTVTTTGTDTCTCPGLATNWEINLADYCNITTTCDLSTGNITFINTGYVLFNATLTTNKISWKDSVAIIEKYNLGSNFRGLIG